MVYTPENVGANPENGAGNLTLPPPISPMAFLCLVNQTDPVVFGQKTRCTALCHGQRNGMKNMPARS